MAKISDFGNTWGKFFCRGETHAVHLARHPSPLHGKNRANWHHLQKIFSARDSSSNVQNRAFWKPLSKFFSNCFARVSTVIDHPCESYLPASPPVSRSILPAALLCKNRGKVETLFENFLIRSVQHRLQRVLSSYGQRSFHLPSISTWRKSAILETPEQKNCQHEARAVNSPTLFNVKIWTIWHRQNQILQQMWPCGIVFGSLRIILNEGWQAQK